MTVSATGQTDLATLLQQILAAQKAQSATAAGEATAPTGQFDPANGAGPPTGSPPPKPDDGAGSLLSSDTLASVISQQGASTSATATASASSQAAQVFDALDTNKDGTVSLDELQAALTSLDGSSPDPAQASGAKAHGGRHHHHHHTAEAATPTTSPTTAASTPASTDTAAGVSVGATDPAVAA